MFNVGERIKTLRKERGIKGIVIAKNAGFTHPFLYGIENNTKKCSIDNLEKICKELGISLSDFFNDEAPTQSPEVIQLIKSVENLTPEQIKQLTNFINSMTENNSNQSIR